MPGMRQALDAGQLSVLLRALPLDRPQSLVFGELCDPGERERERDHCNSAVLDAASWSDRPVGATLNSVSKSYSQDGQWHRRRLG